MDLFLLLIVKIRLLYHIVLFTLKFLFFKHLQKIIPIISVLFCLSLLSSKIYYLSQAKQPILHEIKIVKNQNKVIEIPSHFATYSIENQRSVIDQQITFYKNLLSKQPTHNYVLANLAILYFAKNDQINYTNYLQQVKKLNPNWNLIKILENKN